MGQELRPTLDCLARHNTVCPAACKYFSGSVDTFAFHRRCLGPTRGIRDPFSPFAYLLEDLLDAFHSGGIFTSDQFRRFLQLVQKRRLPNNLCYLAERLQWKGEKIFEIRGDFHLRSTVL